MKPLDVERYIGVPYVSKGRTLEGCDCYGLLRLFYRERLGIDLPEYADSYTDAAERDETRLAVEAGRSLWARVSEPIPGDAVLLRILRDPTHVGVYVGDGVMLHVRAGVNATIQRLDDRLWKTRVEGFYRYVR